MRGTKTILQQACTAQRSPPLSSAQSKYPARALRPAYEEVLRVKSSKQQRRGLTLPVVPRGSPSRRVPKDYKPVSNVSNHVRVQGAGFPYRNAYQPGMLAFGMQLYCTSCLYNEHTYTYTHTNTYKRTHTNTHTHTLTHKHTHSHTHTHTHNPHTHLVPLQLGSAWSNRSPHPALSV